MQAGKFVCAHIRVARACVSQVVILLQDGMLVRMGGEDPCKSDRRKAGWRLGVQARACLYWKLCELGSRVSENASTFAKKEWARARAFRVFGWSLWPWALGFRIP